MTLPQRIQSQPGIKRDGTLLEGLNYVDGQWCRFNRGLPRKMRGYRNIASTIAELFYGMHAFAVGGLEYLHGGSASKCTQYTLNPNAIYQNTSDRTPGAGFVASPANVWQFEAMYDSVSTVTNLIAHPGQNLAAIDSTVATKIFFGDITATSALADTGVTAVSGGIAYIAPYLFKFGNAGLIEWSVANKPSDFTTGAGTAGGPGSARVTGAKLIKGMPLRGNGSGPSGIFWSLDSLVRASFTPSPATFAFDTIDSEISVMSSSGIVLANGTYYWPGVDRWLMFNGVVEELPNQMNVDWFFDHINMAYRQKCFAIKVPRWAEIWWCYPRDAATECSHAAIYNYREGSWYDTVLPNMGRTTGTLSKAYDHLFMTGAKPDSGSNFRVWKHEETNMNEIDVQAVNPVRSYFTTNPLTLLNAQQPSDQTLAVERVEPDFVQTGDMTLTIIGKANARGTDIPSDPITFPDTATGPDTETTPTRVVRRQVRFQFESNAIDGDYLMGATYAHIEPEDGRITD